MRRRIIGLIAAMAMFFGGTLATNNAHAAISVTNDQLYKTAILQGVKQCYDNYAANWVFLRNFTGYESIFVKDDVLGNVTMNPGFTKDGVVYVPTKVGNSLNDSELSCQQVFTGYSGVGGTGKGLKDYYPLPSDLDTYGYVFSRNQGASSLETGDPTRLTDQATITANSVTDLSGNNPNNPVKLSGELICSGSQLGKGNATKGYKYHWEVRGCSGAISMTYNGRNLLTVRGDGTTKLTVSRDNTTSYVIGVMSVGDELSSALGWDLKNSDNSQQSFATALLGSEFYARLNYYLSNAAYEVYNSESGSEISMTVDSTAPAEDEVNEQDSVFAPVGDDKGTAAEAFLRNLGIDTSLAYVAGSLYSNGVSTDTVSYYWSADETYALYYRYLENLKSRYNDFTINCNTEEAGTAQYRFKNGPDQWCNVNLGSQSDNILNEEVSVVRGSYELGAGTVKEILEWLGNENSYTYVGAGAYSESQVNGDGTIGIDGNANNSATDGDSSSTTGNEVLQNCKNGGGAGALGWVVCPVLNWMVNSTNRLYSDFLQQALTTDPALFGQQGSLSSGATYQAWSTFQQIANVVFIILLIVVIFSQLTGIGIDNYGIKRILPKLIIAAVLVNVSYYLCVICVDLSNIVGNGAEQVLTNLAPSVNGSSISIDGSSGVVTGVAISSVAILGGVAGIAAVVANPALLLSLLVSALGVVISIIFLFLLLAGREAALVVLTVISPLALVCYMLPNTKKYFDRFMKIWAALLLLYPIAGLLIGGGNFVSGLLLSAGGGASDAFTAFTAMIVGIVPIFFIPTLLRSSFAGLGNVGAKVSGIGQKLRGTADKGVRSSEGYKNAQRLGLERRTRFRAGIDRDGNDLNVGRFGRMIRGGKRSMAQARVQALKDRDANMRADRLTGTGYQAAVIGQQKAAERDETNDYMTLINNETRNGDDEARLWQMYDNFMSQGEKGKPGAVAAARIAGRRKDTAARFAEAQFKSGAINRYDPSIVRSVAKEVTTGENSKIFSSSAPLQFRYASGINTGEIAPSVTYDDWVKDSAHVDMAMSAFVTKSDELMGVKGSGLREIASLMQNGGVGENERVRLQNLARDTISNRSRIAGWDSTKAAEIAAIAGWNYNASTGGFTDGQGRVVGEPTSGRMDIPRDNNSGSDTASE